MIRARHAFALAAGLALAAIARDATDRWIDATLLPDLDTPVSAQVLDREDRLLRAYTVADGRWRLALTPAQTDPRFLAMLMAYEDRRFPTHAGIDPLALLRAAGQALATGHIVSGGSTLTMQTARLIEDSGTGALPGKLRQIRVALALERRLTKDQILTLYLQRAPYGGNVEGLRAATLAWFGKEPTRLTPAQAALLIALPQSPERRRPDRFPEAARAARDRVLDRAATAGVLTRAEAEAAKAEPIPTERRPFPALAAHLSDSVSLNGADARLHRLCIDKTLQTALEALAAEVVSRQGDRMQIAIVVANHQSHQVLASVGSAAFRADARQGFVDMTRALRSPGSTLKPMVYALAFDAGLAHPETLIDDRPMRFGSYAPQNFDRQFHGTIRLREALQLSLNLPVVEVLDALGPTKLLSALENSGVRYRLPPGTPGLAIGLGGIGVTLQDMVGLYATLADGGVWHPLRVDCAAPAPTDSRQVVSATAAWQVTDILAGLAPPAGAPANRLAYKTGTSYGHRDAWAIGYDGRHVVGVWMGRADGTPVPGAFGADLAAPVLFQAFARLKPALDPQPPAPPATLLLANAQLPQPLQRFRSRQAAFEPQDAPKLAFPPDGAVVESLSAGLLVRVEGGLAPFTFLVDGAPVATAQRQRETILPLKTKGFLTVSVIDANGNAARAAIRLR